MRTERELPVNGTVSSGSDDHGIHEMFQVPSSSSHIASGLLRSYNIMPNKPGSPGEAFDEEKE